MQSGNLISGLGGILSGIFGDSGSPYQASMDQYQQFANQAQNVQNPYLQAGNNAIPQYQNWLKGMEDPSKFVNNLMGKYQESPFAKYQQKQAMRAGINAGSANGLSGSTPLMQQMQQNASNISSQDINSWLQNVLGINTQYGVGNQNLMTQGSNAANSLTNMYGEMGKQMGDAAYGKEAGGQNDMFNSLGGLIQLGMMFI